ncbi:MAG: hypothetical protein IT244_00715 [Bacteroidia bacterium]|nr:hypothetical protein [Bacteroidia bacterium]
MAFHIAVVLVAFKVTEPEVPPPLRPVPAITSVISPLVMVVGAQAVPFHTNA